MSLLTQMSLDTRYRIENPTNDRDHTITALTNSQSIVIVIIINGPTFNF